MLEARRVDAEKRVEETQVRRRNVDPPLRRLSIRPQALLWSVGRRWICRSVKLCGPAFAHQTLVIAAKAKLQEQYEKREEELKEALAEAARMRVELDKALRCVARRLRRPITPLMPSSGRLPPACCLFSMPIPFADGLWWFRERRSSDALYTALAKEVKDEQATLKQRFNELQQRVVEVRHTTDYESTSRRGVQGRSFTLTDSAWIHQAEVERENADAKAQQASKELARIRLELASKDEKWAGVRKQLEDHIKARTAHVKHPPAPA